MFAVDDPEWRKWMNQHFYVRQGVSFLEMTGSQRDAAFGLLRASLSARGFEADPRHHAAQRNPRRTDQRPRIPRRMALLITVMGKPSATEPWGFQLDGHHAIINYFVLGDQVVDDPVFRRFGAHPSPPRASTKGLTILQDEQDRGLDMLLALDRRAAPRAIFNPNKTRNYNVTEAFKDNVVLDYAGARAADFRAEQRSSF